MTNQPKVSAEALLPASSWREAAWIMFTPYWTPESADELELLARELTATQPAAVPTIDLDQSMWESIKQAAAESQWIPKEYYMNEWVSDVCAYLREPAAAGDAVLQVSLTDAVLINNVFMPSNPNKLRKAHPEVVAVAKRFKAAVAALIAADQAKGETP